MYIFFSRRRTMEDTVGFSIDKLVSCCGYKPNGHKDKINDKCRSVLNQFIDQKCFANISDNIHKRKNLDYIEVTLNHDWFDVGNNFAYIDLIEVDKILNFKDYINPDIKSSKITPAKLLLLLSYIRVNKLRRTALQTHTCPQDKPEFFYKHYKNIGIDLNCHEDTIISATTILNQLGIIVSKNIDRYKDDAGNWHTDVTLFVDRYTGWEQELIWAEEHLKSIKKKKYKQRCRNDD